jgi:hypothetical protein
VPFLEDQKRGKPGKVGIFRFLKTLLFPQSSQNPSATLAGDEKRRKAPKVRRLKKGHKSSLERFSFGCTQHWDIG